MSSVAVKASSPTSQWADRIDLDNLPKHVAIIMDGNGRWARKQGMQRLFGHNKGIDAVERATDFALEVGIPILSIWAFSTANWRRPNAEVKGLFNILRQTLKKNLNRFHEQNIRLMVTGLRENLPDDLIEQIDRATELTKHNTRMTLNVVFNYDGRTDIIETTKELARRVKDGEISAEEITEDLFSQHTMTKDLPDPDLMIRTGDVVRISNFMIWQCVFTEFAFLKKHWPQFEAEDFCQAIEHFQGCSRNFGQISP